MTTEEKLRKLVDAADKLAMNNSKDFFGGKLEQFSADYPQIALGLAALLEDVATLTRTVAEIVDEGGEGPEHGNAHFRRH